MDHQRIGIITVCIILLLLAGVSDPHLAFSQTINAPKVERLVDGSSSYARHRQFLLQRIGVIKGTIGSGERSAATSDLAEAVDYAEMKIKTNRLRLAVSRENGHTAGILTEFMVSGDVRITFVFGRNMLDRYDRDQRYMDGVLVQEFQHLFDIETLGWSDGRVRMTRQHETRGHLAQADYYALLPEETTSGDERMVRLMEAAEDAPNGTTWQEYLEDNQGKDFELLDELQRYRFRTLAGLAGSRVHEVFTNLLIPKGRALGASTQNLERFVTRKGFKDLDKDDPAIREHIVAMRKLQTYLVEANNLNEATMQKITKPTSEARAAQKEWKSIYDDLFARNGRITANTEFLSFYTGNPWEPDESKGDDDSLAASDENFVENGEARTLPIGNLGWMIREVPVRIENSEFKEIVEAHASQWGTSQSSPVPGWDNDHLGYEALYNALTSAGWQFPDRYKHHLFGRSHTFKSMEYGSPHLRVDYGSDKDSIQFQFDVSDTGAMKVVGAKKLTRIHRSD